LGDWNTICSKNKTIIKSIIWNVKFKIKFWGYSDAKKIAKRKSLFQVRISMFNNSSWQTEITENAFFLSLSENFFFAGLLPTRSNKSLKYYCKVFFRLHNTTKKKLFGPNLCCCRYCSNGAASCKNHNYFVSRIIESKTKIEKQIEEIWKFLLSFYESYTYNTKLLYWDCFFNQILNVRLDTLSKYFVIFKFGISSYFWEKSR